MLEECLYRYLVGGVERDAVCAPLFRRFVGQAQARKTLKVRLFEVKMTQGRQIERKLRGRPFRVRQRIQDG